MLKKLLLLLVICGAADAQSLPTAPLPNWHPFDIKISWYAGFKPDWEQIYNPKFSNNEPVAYGTLRSGLRPDFLRGAPFARQPLPIYPEVNWTSFLYRRLLWQQ